MFGAVLLALIGLLVDRAVGTVPVFTIIFALGGFVGAAASIYYRYQHNMDAARAARRGGSV